MPLRCSTFCLAFGAAALASLVPAASRPLRAAGPPSASLGIAFPATVGDFRRATGVDGAADGVRYSLQTPGREIAITVRMFPAPVATGTMLADRDAVRAQQCDGQFHGIGRRISAAHPGAELARESLETLPQLGAEF